MVANGGHGEAAAVVGSRKSETMKPSRTLPTARKDELIVEHLPHETLVYDLKRHDAHCLNRTSSLVWECCDGRTTTTEMAEILARQLALPEDERIVFFALDRLRKARLLDREESPIDGISQSRRELVRKLAVMGGLSILLPVVSSIKTPLAAQAGSSTTARECRRCIGVGLPCSNRPGRTCQERIRRGRRRCRCRP